MRMFQFFVFMFLLGSFIFLFLVFLVPFGFVQSCSGRKIC
jgi:hypothetical protein